MEERRSTYTDTTAEKNLQVSPAQPEELPRAEGANKQLLHLPFSSLYSHYSPHSDQLVFFFSTVKSTDVQHLITKSLPRQTTSFITPR